MQHSALSHVHRLITARAAVIASLAWLAGVSGAGAQPLWEPDVQSFQATVQQKERSIFFAAVENGDEENWFGPLVGSSTTEVTVDLAHLDPAATGQASVEVALQGVTTDATVDPDHRVAVSINDVEVGELVFDGRSRGVQRFDFSHALLEDGVNTVGLTASDPSDFSLIDSVSLTYWHTYRADADRLRFTAEAARPIRVGGFVSGAIRLVDVTDAGAPREVTGEVLPEPGGQWAIVARVPGTGLRTLLAFSEATTATPVSIEANAPSTWHAAATEHDYLVVTDALFDEPLSELVALRASQGHTAALVDIRDVYDEFSFGQKTPQALRDFLVQARTAWEGPPDFLVLAGDATMDPRDYAGFGAADFVPTKLVPMDSVELESATDEWFADIDDDGVPELAVGRLPIRTIEQADTMVAKLVNYAAADAGPWATRALVLADEGDDGWDFGEDATRLQSAMPPGYSAQRIAAGELGTTVARDQLLEEVRQGQLLVNYVGHGSTTVWGKEANLLTADDVITGWRPDVGLPVVVAMNCLSGFFHGIYGEESLAETFLRAPQGAVAAWASSSITHAAPQAVVNQEFFELALTGQFGSVGEAVVAAKQVVADRDLRRSWIFFGDPAMRLKGVPGPSPMLDPSIQTTQLMPSTSPLLRTTRDTGADTAESGDREPSVTPETQPPASRRMADFNGDGRDDPLLYARESGLWLAALSGLNDFRYASGQWAPAADLFVAHLNDDALADVFGYDAGTGRWSQSLNNGDGTFTSSSGVWTPGWQATIGHLDGDARDDLFAWDPVTGSWLEALTDGAGGFTYREGDGLPPGRVELVDFNGDRRAELFVYDPPRDQWFVGVGAEGGERTFAGGAGAPDWAVHPANLDADDWADLLVFDRQSGGWVTWLTDIGGGVVFRRGQWRAGDGALSVADLDGDGRDDFFWHESATGLWSAYLNRGADRFTEVTGAWPPGRSVSIGDLDGDGRDDVLAYDRTTGGWSSYRSIPSDGGPGLAFAERSGTWVPGWALVGATE